MSSTIQNLDRESILMLYQADELPAQDRSEVEAMLAGDAGLRALLEEIGSAHQSMSSALVTADASQPLPVPLTSSLRKVSAAMAQWHIDQLRAQPTMHARNGRRYGWMYSAAAVAAMIVVTIFILWSRVDDGKNDQVAKIAKDFEQVDPAPDQAPVADTPVAVVSDSYTPSGGDDADSQLTRAEADLSTLSALTDSLRPAQEAVMP